MIILTKNKSTKFCQITLRIKRFIHKRKKVVPFFCLTVQNNERRTAIIWPLLNCINTELYFTTICDIKKNRKTGHK